MRVVLIVALSVADEVSSDSALETNTHALAGTGSKKVAKLVSPYLAELAAVKASLAEYADATSKESAKFDGAAKRAITAADEVSTSSFAETSREPGLSRIQATLEAIEGKIKADAAKRGPKSRTSSSFVEARKAGGAPATTRKRKSQQRRPTADADVDDGSVAQIEAKGKADIIVHNDGLDGLRQEAKEQIKMDPNWLDHQILEVSSQVDNIRQNIPDDRVLLVLQAAGNKADAQAELEAELASLKKLRNEFSADPTSLLEFNDYNDVDDTTIGADAFDAKLNSLDEKMHMSTELDHDDAAESDPFADQDLDAGRAHVSSLLDKFGGPSFDATDEYSHLPDPMNPASPLDDLSDVPSDFATNKDLPKLYSLDDQLRKMD